MYYKLINGQPIPAKLPLRKEINGTIVELYTPTQAEYVEFGFYPLQSTPPPTHSQRQIAVPSYEMQDGIIVQSWSLADLPPPYIDNNVLDSMEGLVVAYESGLVNGDMSLDAMEAIVEMYEILFGGLE